MLFVLYLCVNLCVCHHSVGLGLGVSWRLLLSNTPTALATFLGEGCTYAAPMTNSKTVFDRCAGLHISRANNAPCRYVQGLGTLTEGELDQLDCYHLLVKQYTYCPGHVPGGGGGVWLSWF